MTEHKSSDAKPVPWHKTQKNMLSLVLSKKHVVYIWTTHTCFTTTHSSKHLLELLVPTTNPGCGGDVYLLSSINFVQSGFFVSFMFETSTPIKCIIDAQQTLISWMNEWVNNK